METWFVGKILSNQMVYLYKTTIIMQINVII